MDSTVLRIGHAREEVKANPGRDAGGSREAAKKRTGPPPEVLRMRRSWRRSSGGQSEGFISPRSLVQVQPPLPEIMAPQRLTVARGL